MTGIERLRRLAGSQDMGNAWTAMLANELIDIADQIERERACDADTAENIRLIVGSVIDDMERHLLGHEGMEDSPVARWARELREALGATASRRESDGVADSPYDLLPQEDSPVARWARELREALGGDGHDPAADVSMSAYDLLPKEEREAIAWVREHGGIESVKAQRFESMPRAVYERKKAGFLDHIAECETALGRRNERISVLEARVRVRERANDELNEELNAMRPRLMPEGYEWPRFESGEPLRYEDRYVYDGREREVWHVDFDSYGEPTILNKDGTRCHPDKGERVKRPAPKVLDADGKPIKVGDTVRYRTGAARGVVESIDANSTLPLVVYRGDNGELYRDASEDLTHTKPEPPDSWERLEEDSRPCERVVRCRDCRRSFEERGELWCRGIVGPPIEPGGFCAWGEPRKGE